MVNDASLNVFFPDKSVENPVLERGQFYNYDPSMGSVLQAYVSEAFQGTGTAREALLQTQAQVERGELKARGPVSLYRFIENKLTGNEPSKKLSKEEWENSAHFRESIDYEDGMTETLAGILADENDRQSRVGTVVSRASGLEKAFGITGSFIGGILEPRNLVGGVAAAFALGGLHGAIGKFAHKSIQTSKQLKRIEDIIGEAGSIKRAASEGLLGAAVLEPGNWEAADSLNKDYGMAETLWNVGLSVGASGLIQGGINYLGKRKGRVVSSQEAKDAALFAISQIAEGKEVDTGIVHDYYDPIMGREVPPIDYDSASLKSLAKDESGILDYFWQEAKHLKERIKNNEFIDINNKSELADALGIRKQGLKTIKQVILELGGVVDVGGELAARGITSRSFPGLIRRTAQDIQDSGDLDISKAGRSLDDLVVDLQERGFFTQKQVDEGVGKNEVLELLERDIHGDEPVYPADINDQINKIVKQQNGYARELDEMGIEPTDSVESIAAKMQEYYADTRQPIGSVVRNVPSDLEQRLQTPDELVEEYVSGYEEWREIDLYDDVDPVVYEQEANAINSDMNELRDIENDIANLEAEIEEMRQGDLLEKDEVEFLSEMEERAAIMEEARTAIKQSMFCLTR